MAVSWPKCYKTFNISEHIAKAQNRMPEFQAPSPETRASEALKGSRTADLAPPRFLPVERKKAVASVIWAREGGICRGSFAS